MPRGAKRGNQNAIRHGLHALTTDDQIRPAARNQKRRLLRQIGTRASDLDPVAKGYVNLLARVLAKIDVADDYVERHGMLRADGEPQPVMKLYVSLVNSARLTMARLEDHLRAHGDDPDGGIARLIEIGERIGREQK
jgi:hypothetical protein